MVKLVKKHLLLKKKVFVMPLCLCCVTVMCTELETLDSECEDFYSPLHHAKKCVSIE